MGKGHTRRRCLITKEEENLRWLLAERRITFKHFEIKYKLLKKQGKIKRSGIEVK